MNAILCARGPKVCDGTFFTFRVSHFLNCSLCSLAHFSVSHFLICSLFTSSLANFLVSHFLSCSLFTSSLANFLVSHFLSCSLFTSSLNFLTFSISELSANRWEWVVGRLRNEANTKAAIGESSRKRAVCSITSWRYPKFPRPDFLR